MAGIDTIRSSARPEPAAPARPKAPPRSTMNGCLVRFRPVARRASAPIPVLLALAFTPAASAGPPSEGMIDLGARDPRLKWISAPKGFKVQVVAAEEQTGAIPTAMAFDD